MWLKNTFPACTSKAGKKKSSLQRQERARWGFTGGIQSWYCWTQGLGEGCTDILVPDLHPLQQMYSFLLMVSAVGLLSEGTWMWERLAGRGETTLSFWIQIWAWHCLMGDVMMSGSVPLAGGEGSVHLAFLLQILAPVTGGQPTGVDVIVIIATQVVLSHTAFGMKRTCLSS